MVISASRRTDIPCYYSKWFMERIRAGYVMTKNPMNPAQIRRVSLDPKDTQCIVFWTKDAKNIMPDLKELDDIGHKYYFQFTVTPYDNTYERNLRPKKDIERSFIELSDMIGREKVIWRYDPIIINDYMTVDGHKKQFEQMAKLFEKHIDTVTVSFVDMYKRISSPLIREASENERAELSRFIADCAKAHGMKAVSCCENGLSQYGIGQAHCIDAKLIERIAGRKLDLLPDKNQRKGCGCAESVDIGAYDTCLNGCIYCYACHGDHVQKKNAARHDPHGEFLLA